MWWPTELRDAHSFFDIFDDTGEELFKDVLTFVKAAHKGLQDF